MSLTIIITTYNKNSDAVIITTYNKDDDTVRIMINKQHLWFQRNWSPLPSILSFSLIASSDCRPKSPSTGRCWARVANTWPKGGVWGGCPFLNGRNCSRLWCIVVYCWNCPNLKNYGDVADFFSINTDSPPCGDFRGIQSCSQPPWAASALAWRRAWWFMGFHGASQQLVGL